MLAPAVPQPWQALRGPATTCQPLRLRLAYRRSLQSALQVATPRVKPGAAAVTNEQCRAWAGCGTRLKAAIALTATAAISNLVMALSSLQVTGVGSPTLTTLRFARFIGQLWLESPVRLIPPGHFLIAACLILGTPTLAMLLRPAAHRRFRSHFWWRPLCANLSPRWPSASQRGIFSSKPRREVFAPGFLHLTGVSTNTANW